MRFDDLLNESSEVMTLNARLLNGVETKLAKEFQDFCKITHEYVFGDKSKKDWDDTIVRELITKLEKYKRFGFCAELIKDLSEMAKTHDKMVRSKELKKSHLPKMSMHADDILAALEAGNFDAVDDTSAALGALLDDLDAWVDINTEPKKKFKAKTTKQSSWFFSGGATELLDIIDGPEYEKIISIDFGQPVYTYTNFPTSKMEDTPEYLVAFMLNLEKDGKPKRLKSNVDFRKYLMLAKSGSDSYKVLMDMVENYLRNNNKSLIPKIVKYIDDHPEIKAANNKEKKNLKVVYRGIPGYTHDDGSQLTKSEVVLNDKKEYAVATSPHYSAAKNFAYAKGHLDAERNSDFGFIIEYEVNPESIILATYVLGTAYGETEVLIDPNKAKVIKVSEV